MKAFVVIATKGRAKETFTLLDYLSKQTYPIEKVIVVGSEPNDVAGLESHTSTQSGNVMIFESDKAGLTIQRNYGLNKLLPHVESLNHNDWFVTFFDDDFRPAYNWLENAQKSFIENPKVVGLSGWVLADGIKTLGISEEEAQRILSSDTHLSRTPWFGNRKEVEGLYGCNMTFRGCVAFTQRFDENLPFYGWQEDVDYGGNALKFGKLLYVKECRGVHLGVTGGRTSGLRFGYSQIANPTYLAKKGTMNKKYASRIILRNVASNIFHTITFDTKKDYKGRLQGNIKAAFDLLSGKCHPANILNI